MSTRQAALRNWCFTLNNYTDQMVTILHSQTERPDTYITYMIYQHEISESGTPHLQGYIELKRRMSLRALKRRLNLPTIHLEPRRGTAVQARDYCLKEDTRDPAGNGNHFEFGTIRRPRGRPSGPLEEVTSAIADGMSMNEIAETFPATYVRSHKGLLALQSELADHRCWPMEIIIYYGKTGTGKSYKANHDYPDAYKCPWPAKGGWWWPNYGGEETVILDEFRHQISYDKMLHLFDRYAWTVQYKGGHYKFRSKRVVITTNIPPHEWYKGVEDVAPLRRRISEYGKIYKFAPIVWDVDDETDEETPIPQFTEQPLQDRPVLDFSVPSAQFRL